MLVKLFSFRLFPLFFQFIEEFQTPKILIDLMILDRHQFTLSDVPLLLLSVLNGMLFTMADMAYYQVTSSSRFRSSLSSPKVELRSVP